VQAIIQKEKETEGNGINEENGKALAFFLL